MRTQFLLIILAAFLASAVNAQTTAAPKTPVTVPDPASEAAVLAKAAQAAHGGDKLRQMRTLVIRGSLDLNVFNQSTAATFYIAISGDKYAMEINNPFQPLKQIYDGKQTFSTMRGASLPPVTSLGFPLLPRIGDTGYVVSAVPDAKKKKKGFRVTTPDGFYTDFFVDEKTGQIKSYESSYEVGDRLVTTSVEIDEMQTVEGVVVPKKYSQRFDLGQMTAYASFKAKEILVNSELAADVFAMPDSPAAPR
jgi:hypothetical protein